MPDIVLPEYGRRSLADVLPALLAALGVGRASGLTVEPARAAVLLLVDGLGAELLRAHRADAPFLASLPDGGPLTVGFPSSTVIGLASVGTGLPPGSHGLLGTSFRLGGGEFDALRWTADGRDQRERHPPERVQPARTAFETAEAAGVAVTVVSGNGFRDSGLTRAVLRGGEFAGTVALGDLAAEVVAAAGGAGRCLVYGYHGELDTMGHLHGPGSPAWRMQLRQVDRLVETIVDHLPAGTVLAVTGDHGMVAMDRVFDAEADPDLRAGVRLLTGDPRARQVHAEPGAAADVLATWQGVLGDAALVVPAGRAVEDGWFGPLAAHAAERIGDVVVAALGGTGVIRPSAEPLISRMTGQHGSLSSREQLVPLLLARR